MPQPECLKHLFKGGRAPYQFRFRTETTQKHHEDHIHVWGPDFGLISISLHTLELLAPPSVTAKCPLREIMKILKDHRLALLEELEAMQVKGGLDHD